MIRLLACAVKASETQLSLRYEDLEHAALTALPWWCDDRPPPPHRALIASALRQNPLHKSFHRFFAKTWVRAECRASERRLEPASACSNETLARPWLRSNLIAARMRCRLITSLSGHRAAVGRGPTSFFQKQSVRDFTLHRAKAHFSPWHNLHSTSTWLTALAVIPRKRLSRPRRDGWTPVPLFTCAVCADAPSTSRRARLQEATPPVSTGCLGECLKYCNLSHTISRSLPDQLPCEPAHAWGVAW